MQVSVEKTSELSRKMTVSLPEDMVDKKLEARYKSLARTVKVDGFRPGKVPVRVVKKMYADRVKGEVLGDLIQETYPKALEKEELNPAGHPHINSASDADAGFEYIAEFEVYPEISLDGVSSLEIKRPVATVEQDDIDGMVAKLKEQKKEWSDAERAVENADRVTIHFSGVCEGENFTDGKVENYLVEIGSEKMIPGFEDELVGLEVGASKTFEVTFPEDYGSEKLAGKVAEFDIEVVKVEMATLPEIDEEFIKAYGIEDGLIESFNADVKSNMERELALGLKEKLKKSALDELYEKIEVTVPKVLIDEEVKNVMKPYEENMKKQNMSLDDLDLPTDMFEEQAKRRVVLGLLLGEIIKNNEITVDDAKVRTTITDMADSYERPQDVLDWYFSDETRLNEVKQMVLEEQTVEWIVGQAQVTEEHISFNDVMDKQSN
jgi:trigger factor